MPGLLAARADVPKYDRKSLRATEKNDWRKEHEVHRYLGR